MRKSRITSLISVFEVSDMERSLAWYRQWLGEPDSIPMEGVAEYQLGAGSWLQLSVQDSPGFGAGTVIVGVDDVKEIKRDLEADGISVGEITDYEVVLVLDVLDPDGNQISFAQEL